MRINERSVMRHSRKNIVATVVMPVIVFATTVPSVPVRARWAPITSLLRRLTSAPVWVRVKNESGRRCTWSKRATRRSKMTPSPMIADHQRSRNDSSAWARAATTTSPPSTVMRLRSPSAMAPSMISRNNSGGTTPSTDESTTVATKPATMDR